jgi:large subunit ribosomal protein L4e
VYFLDRYLTEAMSFFRPAPKRAQLKKNPLKNLGVMLKLNPHVKATKRAAILAQERNKEARGKAVEKKRKAAGKKQ